MIQYDELIGVEKMYKALNNEIRKITSFETRLMFGNILADTVIALTEKIRAEAREQVAAKVRV